MFCRGLKRHGATVLAIVDCPYDSLRRELREYIDDCYVVSSMENYDEMVRAMGYFTYRYGKIDWVESTTNTGFRSMPGCVRTFTSRPASPSIASRTFSPNPA